MIIHQWSSILRMESSLLVIDVSFAIILWSGFLRKSCIWIQSPKYMAWPLCVGLTLRSSILEEERALDQDVSETRLYLTFFVLGAKKSTLLKVLNFRTMLKQSLTKSEIFLYLSLTSLRKDSGSACFTLLGRIIPSRAILTEFVPLRYSFSICRDCSLGTTLAFFSCLKAGLVIFVCFDFVWSRWGWRRGCDSFFIILLADFFASCKIKFAFLTKRKIA